MININDKTQCEKLSKLFEELSQRKGLLTDGGYADIGYNTMTKTMYIPLEHTLDLKDNLTLVLAISGLSVYYLVTDTETGEETEYSYDELLREADEQKEEENDDWKYLCPNLHWGGNYGCDLCNYEGKVIADKDNCEMEKVWLNKKGFYDYRLHKKWFEEREEKEESESEEEEEEEEEEVRVRLFEFEGKSYFKSVEHDFIYDREKKEVVGVWSEELQKIILDGEETDDQKVIAVVEKHNTEIDKTRFTYILTLMVNYPCSMEEQDKRRQLLSDKDFADLYAEMITDFMNKKIN